MPFRKSDMRRVQSAFDAAIAAPFEAEASLSVDYLKLSVFVRDPDNEAAIVAQCYWDFDTTRKASRLEQPNESEVTYMVTAFQTLCLQYQPAEA
jgi:hypothetical protein